MAASCCLLQAWRRMPRALPLSLLILASVMPPLQAQGNAQGAASTTAPTGDGDRSSGGATSGMGDAKLNAAVPDAAATRRKLSFGVQDRRRLRALAQAHLAEIKLSALATANGGDPATRGYAEQMLEAHGRALDELRLLARRGGVILPGGEEPEQVAILHALSLKTGVDFNRTYLQQAGLAGHERNLRLFDDTAKGAYAPELKAYAVGLVADVTRHLQLAQRMQAEPAKAAGLVAAARMAGQSGSVATTADVASDQRFNNSGEKGSASLAGAAVHPGK